MLRSNFFPFRGNKKKKQPPPPPPASDVIEADHSLGGFLYFAPGFLRRCFKREILKMELMFLPVDTASSIQPVPP